MESMTGYEELRRGAAWLDLSDRGKIRVSGEDRARFLHAMSTNHVQQLDRNHGLYTFFLNDKGRILADAWLYNLGDDLLLDTEPETARGLFDHLERYVIADDVTLRDETADWAAIGLEGPRAGVLARELGFSLPAGAFGVQAAESGFVAQVAASGTSGFRFFVPAAQKSALIARFEAQGALHATPEEVRTVRLEQGAPRYGEDISARYLVQETQVDAVHSNKGCYLGQEIVERVRSRGQVHRLLVPIRLAGKTPPEPGVKLTFDGSEAGEITSAAYSPQENEIVGLAYVRTHIVDHRFTMTLAATDPPVSVFIR